MGTVENKDGDGAAAPVGTWGNPEPAPAPPTGAAPEAVAGPESVAHADEPETPLHTFEPPPTMAPRTDRFRRVQTGTGPGASAQAGMPAMLLPPERQTNPPGRPASMGGRRSLWVWFVLVTACAGFFFAATSTSDFVQHVDGQIHAIHCSVLPGGAANLEGSSCRDAMFSPYSSFFRSSIWGGIPVSLLGLGVFSFLAAFALYLGLKRDVVRRDTGFLFLGSLVPVITSGIYAFLSATEIGGICQVCLGIYIASGLTFVAALVAHVVAPRSPPGTKRWGRWALWFTEGVAFVALLVVLYVAMVPSDRKSIEGCGGHLVQRDDVANVILHFPRAANTTPALAVIDPFCPTCRALDTQLKSSGLDQKLAMDVLLFPLDSKCNWMVKESMHPGACTVSEAMLCAPEAAPQILAYAFKERETLAKMGKENQAALKADLEDHFPAVKGCLGSEGAKAKVNKSLRFAVANALPVRTPQLFIDDTGVCAENLELGLEYTITRMIERAQGGR